MVGAGKRIEVRQPHARRKVLGTMRNATTGDAQAAVDAAKAAAPGWRELSFDDRAAILLKAAELLSGPWRAHLNAATMLGQSKTAYQAEIDAACELIDFWRINVHFARQILAEQPLLNAKGIWNRTDHRPLEGFVYAITPFNFTAIAGNLPTAPALMGNTVVWKPSPTQQFAAHLTMALLEEAGMPPGVINMVTGDGINVSRVALADPDLAGIHFTGSTPTFQHLWQEVGTNLPRYQAYPRLVGETGGKDFILAHPSADPDVLRTAMIRGAFEYQGQKCSAASRAYVPRSLWKKIKADLASITNGLPAGRRHRPVQLHGRRHRRARLRQALRRDRPGPRHGRRRGGGRRHLRRQRGLVRAAHGARDRRPDRRVVPHRVLRPDPVGPRLPGPPVRQGARPDGVLRALRPDRLDHRPGPGRDRATRSKRLRFAAGNFYVNDKPTGAVVGQQPFGGGRASGTNDKAGAAQNLLRWTSARSIKETFDPPKSHAYPHMG